MIGGKKVRIAATGLRPASERTKDLIFFKGLMEAGKIKPVIDRRYPLEQIAMLAGMSRKGTRRAM